MSNYKKFDKIPSITANIKNSSNFNTEKEEANSNSSSLLPAIESKSNAKLNPLNSSLYKKDSFKLKNINFDNDTNNKIGSISINNISTVNNYNVFEGNANSANLGGGKTILGKLDQQIITNLKATITSLKEENTNLKDEIFELQRNYSALISKTKEDAKKISLLESSSINIKDTSEDDSIKYKNTINALENQIEDYKKTIEENEKKISSLESALMSNSNDQSSQTQKLKEKLESKNNKEQSLNSMISYLNDKLAKANEEINKKSNTIKDIKASFKVIQTELNDKNKETLKTKNLEEELTKLKEEYNEISNQKDYNNNLMENNNSKINELSKELSTIKNDYFNIKNSLNKKKTEIEIAEKLIHNEKERSRELNKELSEKNGVLEAKEEIIKEYLLKIEELESIKTTCSSLNKQLSIITSEKNKIESEFNNFKSTEMEYLMINLNKITEINESKDEEIIKLKADISTLIKENEEMNKMKKFKENSLEKQNEKMRNTFYNKEKLINQQISDSKQGIKAVTNDFLFKLDLFDNKIKEILSKKENSFTLIQSNLNKLKEDKFKNKNKISEEDYSIMKTRLSKQTEDYNSLKEENKKQLNINKKIDKEKEELYEKYQKIFFENRAFEKEIKQYKLNISVHDKMKVQFKQANEIFQKLKLAVETLYLNIGCKECGQHDEDFVVLKCGHSLCKICLTREKACPECKQSFFGIDYTSLTVNNTLNEIGKRVLYLNQVKEDIDQLIKLTNYFN